jgi:hypothetical protein
MGFRLPVLPFRVRCFVVGLDLLADGTACQDQTYGDDDQASGDGGTADRVGENVGLNRSRLVGVGSSNLDSTPRVVGAQVSLTVPPRTPPWPQRIAAGISCPVPTATVTLGTDARRTTTCGFLLARFQLLPLPPPTPCRSPNRPTFHEVDRGNFAALFCGFPWFY